jgi:hypothetical protein
MADDLPPSYNRTPRISGAITYPEPLGPPRPLPFTGWPRNNIKLLSRVVCCDVVPDIFSVTTPCIVTLNRQTERYESVICGGGFEQFLLQYTIRGLIPVASRSKA